MRRVVITGLGTVSPCGPDTASTWSAVKAGRSGIRPIARFDATDFTSRVAGECGDFNPEQYIEKKRVREGDRFIHLAIGAADQAVKQAGIDALSDEAKHRVGTVIGVGLCGLELIERMARVLNDRGPRKITPYFIPATIANLAPGQVSMRFGFKGPSFTTTSACSSGAHAIGESFRWIQHGEVDVAVAGGAEATITGLGVGGFTSMRALSTGFNDEPHRASRPFDQGRDGFVISEGAGVIVLEEREHAMKRGAPIFAELVGYGATSDAYHLTQPAPDGEGAQRAMRHALKDARVDPSRVTYINAHATSTPIGDVQELRAIKAVFGERATKDLWISSTKSMTGHLLGAAGGLEAIFSVLALKEGVAPPTINLESPDPDAQGLDLVPHEARERDNDIVVSNAFGFGGTNVCLVFARH